MSIEIIWGNGFNVRDFKLKMIFFIIINLIIVIFFLLVLVFVYIYFCYYKIFLRVKNKVK